MRTICAGLQLDGGSESTDLGNERVQYTCNSDVGIFVQLVGRRGDGRQPQDSAALAAHVAGGQARVATYRNANRHATVGAALSVAERIAVVVPRIRTCPQIASIGMS